MPQRTMAGLVLVALCAACGAKSANFDWGKYQPPDWHKYQARDVKAGAGIYPPTGAVREQDAGRVTFADLKSESDQSLARRLLGAAGQRIAYIDRHRDRWRYYRSDNEPAESIDLYTHPDALGSQYGLCGTEKYTINFDDSGHISTVSVAERYGVEGAIFQKPDFDWNYYYNVMCKSVPASHAPSYFPASDSITAQDLAMLLIPTIELAHSSGSLPYRLTCRGFKQRCRGDIRNYLGDLRLEDIDSFNLSNCPLPGGPQAVCFTIETGEGRLGPFPKTITVKGSTYMNNVRVDSVDVDEGFTVS
ncbi:MAG: hypothetical protein HOP95_04430 [Sphingomonas sp.]|nr:hypothetical protein [Sphingomonas sp.]